MVARIFATEQLRDLIFIHALFHKVDNNCFHYKLIQ